MRAQQRAGEEGVLPGGSSLAAFAPSLGLDGLRTAEAKRLHFIFLPVFKLPSPSFAVFLLDVPPPAGRSL